MKTLTMRSMMAAVLAVVAGTGSAQTYKAEIPMSFRAGETPMSPGSYILQVVTTLTGTAHVNVRAADGRSAAMLMPIPGSDIPKAWHKQGKAQIGFDCRDGSCTLARFWNGLDDSAYEFPARKQRPQVEPVGAVTVALTKAR